MTHWIEVLLTMIDGPATAVSGLARATHADTGPTTLYSGHYGIAPSHIGFGLGPLRLCRLGRRTRLETEDHIPIFISDGETAWVFQSDHETPVETTIANIRVHDPGRELIVSRDADRWARGRFRRPTQEIMDVEFLGRRCWKVELGSEEQSVPPQTLIVDIETGAIVQTDTQEGSAAFDTMSADRSISESSFRWTGATRSPIDLHAEHTAAEVLRKKQNMDWFRNSVCPDPMRASVVVDFTPTEVGRDVAEPEAFEAHFEKGAGRLWRRARSAEDWYLPRNWTRHYPTPIRAWSTQEYDWACAIGLGAHALTDATLAELQRSLHPGDEVIGTPPIP